MDLICRQYAIAQSGLTSGTLSRLDKSGVVVPKKIGSDAHPAVLYTPRQVQELKLVAKIRDRCTPTEIKRIVESSQDLYCVPCCYIVMSDDAIKWVAKAQLGEAVVELMADDFAVVKILELQTTND